MFDFDFDFSFGLQTEKNKQNMEKQSLQKEEAQTSNQNNLTTDFELNLDFSFVDSRGQQNQAFSISKSEEQTFDLTSTKPVNESLDSTDVNLSIELPSIDIDTNVTSLSFPITESHTENTDLMGTRTVKDKKAQDKDFVQVVVTEEEIDIAFDKQETRSKGTKQEQQQQICERYKDHFMQIADLIKVIDTFFRSMMYKRFVINQFVYTMGCLEVVYIPVSKIVVNASELDSDAYHVYIQPFNTSKLLVSVDHRINTNKLRNHITQFYKHKVETIIVNVNSYVEHDHVFKTLAKNVQLDPGLLNVYKDLRIHPHFCVKQLLDSMTEESTQQSEFELDLSL